MLTPGGYENGLARTTTARGEVRVVILVESAERAREFRRAIADPAVPGGIGSWEVIVGPDADTVTSVLSDPTVDIAYCALPIEAGQIVAANGPTSIDDLGGSPALVVFQGLTDPALGVSVVDNGGLSSVLTEDALGSEPFLSLIGLLSVGVSTAASVAVSGVAAETRTRIVGDPGVEIASHGSLSIQVNRARSERPTAHRIERGSVLSLSARIGSEQKQLFDEFQPLDELSGTVRVDGPTVGSSTLLGLLDQNDSIVRLNGRVLFPERIETEADIEELARRHLSGGSDPAERVSESRSE